MDIFIRADEGCGAQPLLLWDTVWDAQAGAGTWALAGPNETMNRGGLQATAELETAVVLCLFTDRRCPADHPLASYADPHDLRGWWGDGVDVRADLGETAMGSLLWLLERSTATQANAQWAQSLATEALACLIGQGAVASVTATAAVLPLPSEGIALDVSLYAQSGTKLYARRFAPLYGQLDAAPPVPANPCGPIAETLLRPGAILDFGGIDLVTKAEDWGGAESASCFVDIN